MKLIEEILCNANEKNFHKIMDLIESQIDCLRENHENVNGFSLMTVLNLFSDQYSEESLRKDGYVLTLEDFRNDAQKYLKLAQDKPIIYNAKLKRLFKGYKLFKDKYVKGHVLNGKIFEEMCDKLQETLLAEYDSLNGTARGMPQSLSVNISNCLELAIDSMNNWFWSECISKEDSSIREYANMLSRRIIELWGQGSLPELITKQLTSEKEQINSVHALINCFQDKSLPENVMKKITEQIVGEIIADMQADKLNTGSALGALIAKKRDETFQSAEVNLITPILQDWQCKKVSAEVALELQKYIRTVIESLRQELIDSLSEKFSFYVVKNFIEGIRTNDKKSYDKDTARAMTNLCSDIAREVLLAQRLKKPAELKECLEFLNIYAMTKFHDYWIVGAFTSEENAYISHKVFASLDEIARKIQLNIWANLARSHNAVLQEAFANLTREKSELTTQIKQLTAVVTQLNNQVARMPISEAVAKEPAERENTAIKMCY